MAKDNKKLVQAITSQEENFAQWYTDICVKAELVEYSSVKGFIILRPYGYNQGLCNGSLLVEVGAAGNSLDEAIYSARLFAVGFAETLGAEKS